MCDLTLKFTYAVDMIMKQLFMFQVLTQRSLQAVRTFSCRICKGESCMGGDSHGDNYNVIVFWAMTTCSLLENYRHSEDGCGLFFRKKHKGAA
jgi:hypothetical protein